MVSASAPEPARAPAFAPAASRRVAALVAGSLAILGGCSTPPAGPALPPTPGSPLAGMQLFVDPQSRAAAQAAQWRTTRPADAAAMDQIASQPIAIWMTSSTPDVRASAAGVVARAAAQGAVPVFATYNIPNRDCSGAGGGDASYRTWIRAFAAGLTRQSVVILEPDAIPQADCLTPSARAARYALIADAVQVLKAANAIVYLDAGHARWLSPQDIGQRLLLSGIAQADGFALNVAHYLTTSSSITYGEAISRETGGKHFIIDTGRNGRGGSGTEWCNVPDQALGANPTVNTGHPLVDALLWVKQPGESDGTCNGGPPAGTWWPEYALGLVQRR